VIEPREPAYAETVPQNIATGAILVGAILGAVVLFTVDVVGPWYLASLLGAVIGTVVAGLAIGVVAALLDRSNSD